MEPHFYRFLQARPPLVHILSQLSPTHALISFFFNFYFISFSSLLLRLLNGHFSSVSMNKTSSEFLIFRMRATYRAHPNPFNFSTLLWSGEYKLWSTSLCRFLFFRFVFTLYTAIGSEDPLGLSVCTGTPSRASYLNKVLQFTWCYCLYRRVPHLVCLPF